MKLLKLLLIIILILFPFGEILRFDIGQNIIIKPLDFLVGLTGIYWILLKFKNSEFKFKNFKKIFKTNKFVLAIFLFSFIGLFSLVLNLTWLRINEFYISILYLLRWIFYALIFFAVSGFDDKFKKRIVSILCIDGLIILLLGFLQYFFYNSLGNLFYLGWDKHMHRIFSVFFDPNFSGAFFVLFFILIAGLFVSHLKIKKRIIIYTIGLVMLLTLIAVLLTFSRSGILMLIAGTTTFLFLINKRKMILVLFLILLLFVSIASPKFYDENMNLFRFNSSEARISNYLTAIKIFQDHPILGVGFNSYRYTKRLYNLPHDWIDVPSHADAGVDNSFLFVLTTTGIMGLLVYLGIWFYLLKKAYLQYKKEKNILAIIFISSSIGLFVDALFINSLFFAPIMLWMWIIAGIADT